MDRMGGNAPKITPALHPALPLSVSGTSRRSNQTPARLLLSLTLTTDPSPCPVDFISYLLNLSLTLHLSLGLIISCLEQFSLVVSQLTSIATVSFLPTSASPPDHSPVVSKTRVIFLKPKSHALPLLSVTFIVYVLKYRLWPGIQGPARPGCHLSYSPSRSTPRNPAEPPTT